MLITSPLLQHANRRIDLRHFECIIRNTARKQYVLAFLVTRLLKKYFRLCSRAPCRERSRLAWQHRLVDRTECDGGQCKLIHFLQPGTHLWGQHSTTLLFLSLWIHSGRLRALLQVFIHSAPSTMSKMILTMGHRGASTHSYRKAFHVMHLSPALGGLFAPFVHRFGCFVLIAIFNILTQFDQRHCIWVPQLEWQFHRLTNR